MLTLGPICGASQTEAKIWIKGDIRSSYKIRYGRKFSNAIVIDFRTSFNGIGVVSLKGLSSNTEYLYDILDKAGEVVFTGGRFATFPDTSSHEDFCFGFFSCHNPDENDSMEMWKRLSDMMHTASRPGQPESIRFLLAIGDQMYADKPSKKYLDWINLERLEHYFYEKYDDYWDFEPIQNTFARCPVYMTWDDHEIRDGWGSRQIDRPGANPVYAAAATAYRDHQLLHNPFISNPKRRKHYSFRFGGAGFIVLDLRSERIMAHGQMMSRTQWRWLRSVIAEYADVCDVVFVVCSVPFLHLKWSLKQLIGGIRPKAIEDLWNSDNWRDEGMKFAKIIFDNHHKSDGKARIFLLGGDVHVATFGEVSSTQHRDIPPIRQFTSSGISNVPSGINYFVRSSKLFDMFGDPSIIKGRMPHVITKRNFGLVKLTTNTDGKYRVKFDVHYQGNELPKTLYEDGYTKRAMLI